MDWLWRRVLQAYEQALEIAITGIGVVFLALASLTLVTILISRYIKEDKVSNMETSESSPDDENHGMDLKADADPMLTAAMVAAIQVADGNLSRVGGGTSAPPNWAAFGAWRAHGRQLMMQSQGLSRNPRTLKQ